MNQLQQKRHKDVGSIRLTGDMNEHRVGGGDKLMSRKSLSTSLHQLYLDHYSFIEDM